VLNIFKLFNLKQKFQFFGQNLFRKNLRENFLTIQLNFIQIIQIYQKIVINTNLKIFYIKIMRIILI